MVHAGRTGGGHFPTILRKVLIALVALCPLVAAAADETRALGDAAPPFTLPALDGTKYSLEASLKNRPVLVAFLSAPCKPCEDSIADLLEVCELHGADGSLEVAAIALKGTDILKRLLGDGRPGCRLSFVEELAVDERFLTADAYGVIATPTFFLVGKNGKILWKSIGRLKAAKTELEFKKLLAP